MYTRHNPRYTNFGLNTIVHTYVSYIVYDRRILCGIAYKINHLRYINRLNNFHDNLIKIYFRLRIKRAIQSDTGNYTCVPTIAKSSSVYVHVISGKFIFNQFDSVSFLSYTYYTYISLFSYSSITSSLRTAQYGLLRICAHPLNTQRNRVHPHRLSTQLSSVLPSLHHVHPKI